MKVLIIGAGAMASLFGGRLKAGKGNVTLLNRLNSHVDEINRSGLTIIEKDDTATNVPLKVIQEISQDDNYDIILVLIKAHANETVLGPLKEKIDSGTLFITMQNGIGNLETIRKIFPNNPVAVGSAGCGASIENNGKIIHRGWGKNYIGYPEDLSNKELIEEFVMLLCESGLDTDLAEDVQSVIWSKLIINLAFNGVTAMTRLKNGDIINTVAGKDILANVVNEAVAIAEVSGITLKHDNPVAECLRMGQEDIGRNKSSMLMDILNQRKTEIDVINGAISNLGKQYGIPTPYNDMVTNLIHIIESNYENQVNQKL